jgi:hypothetical protein
MHVVRLRRPSSAMVVAMLALFIAAGGANAMADAAVSAKTLITGKQIKKGSIGVDRLSASARRKLRGTAGPAGPAGVAGVVGPAGPAGPAGAAELQEDSVGGRELRSGAVGQDEIFDGGVHGAEVADRSLTSDDFSVAAGRVVDNGSDLASGECSTNTVDAGTENISNDVVAVTLDSASFGSTPTSVRHAISTDSFIVVICNGTGVTQPRPDFDWMVFNRP